MQGRTMGKARLEAFSDGVIAIIITIMVLELKVPHGTDLGDLLPMAPILFGYLLSFVYVGIYWVNHHHLLQRARGVNGPIMWANLHLLFWMSLIPFVTNWMGDHHGSVAPVASYGFVLLMTAAAYQLLALSLARQDGPQGRLAQASGRDRKGKGSLLLYAGGTAMSFVYPPAGLAVYVLVAALWFVPDPRVEAELPADAD